MFFNDEIPKVFWKYYDLFRRGMISLQEFSEQSGLEEQLLTSYLNEISE